MARQTFRERNRRRREESALITLYGYALSAGIADPKRSAERAARELHGPGSDGANARRSGGGADTAANASAGRSPAAAADNGERVPHRLEDRTKEQLYARAQELDIAGRSQMNKDELIDAIRGNS